MRAGARAGISFFSFCCARRLALSDARGRPASPTRVDREPAAGRGFPFEQVRLPLMRCSARSGRLPAGESERANKRRPGVRGGCAGGADIAVRHAQGLDREKTKSVRPCKQAQAESFTTSTR